MPRHEQNEDPRNPDAIKVQPAKFEEPPPDWMSLLSLLFGVAGLMLKIKLVSWIALFCCISSLANMKQSELDVKQLVCSITFTLLALFMSYVAPKPGEVPVA